LGYSLARGFEKVLADWDDFKRDDVATFLQQIAMAVSSRIGGTSGPLWGTAFLRASTVAKGIETVDGAAAVKMLRAATDGIKARGNSDLGDKTLLDALIPATDELERQLAAGSDPEQCRAAFAKTARECAEATKDLEAKRGRASYSGERSVGSPDAGAMAIATIVERISQEWPSA
jgi:dihydroxyacetone kinase/dihydroxyacetone kinase-like protein